MSPNSLSLSLSRLQEAKIFLILGVLIFINIVGFILALNLVSPITAAIYQPLIPVWTAFWAVLFKVQTKHALTRITTYHTHAYTHIHK